MTNIYRNSAWLYDIDTRDNLSADIPFYIDYARAGNGEVLELGCGTGRVALALAKEGFNVTGLDLSTQMLDIFRQKLAASPDLERNIKLFHGSMADFHLEQKYALIIAPFRAFQAVTADEDINGALACIYEHLTDDGIFIVNVFNPHPVMDESWCYDETVQWERLDEKTGNHVVKKHWGDRIDTVNQIIYPHYAYEVTYPDGKTERITDDLSLKYYYPEQLRATVEKRGFIIKESFAWYDKAPLESIHREIIYVCGK